MVWVARADTSACWLTGMAAYDYGELAPSKDTTPCSSWEHLTECEEYVLREVPPRLHNALSRELEADPSAVEQGLRRKTAELVTPLIAEAFREFREHCKSAPDTSGAVSAEQQSVQNQGEEGAVQPGDAGSLPDGFDFNLIDNLNDQWLTEFLQQDGGVEIGEQAAVEKKRCDSGYESNRPDDNSQAGAGSTASDERQQ